MTAETSQRILVTGGTGFLGSHIVEASLAQGHSVVALVRSSSDIRHLQTLKGLELVYGDLQDTNALNKATAGCTAVIHSAARVLEYGGLAEFQKTNVTGTQNLLDAAKSQGVQRFIFVSSPSVTMELAGPPPLNADESSPYPKRYCNFYAQTKAEAERRVLAANEMGFTTCSIRPRCVWGPRDAKGAMTKVIQKMSRAKLSNMSGGRETLVSMCYCDNAAHACLLATQAPSEKVGGKAYFVTDGEPVELWSFCDEIAPLFNLPPIRRNTPPWVIWSAAYVCDMLWKLPWLHRRWAPPISRYVAALLCSPSTYNINAAKRDLGYAPIVDRQTGLIKTKQSLIEMGIIQARERPAGD